MKKKRYSGKNGEEWRDWGEKFGKRMEKKGREFGEEVEDLAERFGRRMERRRERERGVRGWWFTTLGFVGPFIGSIFAFICLVIGIWVLNFFNIVLQSSFISLLTGVVLRNIHWFFAAFLFFGYDDYFTKRYHNIYWIVKPITGSVGVLFVLWIAIWLLNTINIPVNSNLITKVSNFLSVNFWGIFVLFVVLGYAFVFIKKKFL